MPEKSKSNGRINGSLTWLRAEFGVNPAKLDQETQEFATRMGPMEVCKLVKSNTERVPYRQGRMNPNERVNVLEAFQRLTEGEWQEWFEIEDEGVLTRNGSEDKPIDWLRDELEELEDLFE